MRLSINDQRARDLAYLLRTEMVPAEDVRPGDVLVLNYAIVRVERVHVDGEGMCQWRDDDENGSSNFPGSQVLILARDTLKAAP
jgi:hypothetical protein